MTAEPLALFAEQPGTGTATATTAPAPPTPPATALELLDYVTSLKPGGEHREGQRRMCAVVDAGFDSLLHSFTEAGTGTGKSFAYLVPAMLRAVRDKTTVVVATASKSLQDQLTRDCAFLAEVLEEPLGRKPTFAVLKGRSNYICRAKVSDTLSKIHGDDEDESGQATLTGLKAEPEWAYDPDAPVYDSVAEWMEDADLADKAELPFQVSDKVWRNVSIDSRECPGAKKCKFGAECFAEKARARAQVADIVIVNTHLFALNLAADGRVLPPHHLVVLDEGHMLEDIAASAFGVELRASRIRAYGNQVKGLVAEGRGQPALEAAASKLADVLNGKEDQRVDPTTGDIHDVLQEVDEAVALARREVINVPASTDKISQRRDHAMNAGDGLRGDIAKILAYHDDDVAWVEAGRSPVLKVVPIDVGPALRDSLFLNGYTVAVTSATLRTGTSFEPLTKALGFRDGPLDDLTNDDDPAMLMRAVRKPECVVETDNGDGRVGAGDRAVTMMAESPFDYQKQSMLYCPQGMPDPRNAGFADAMTEELVALIEAAGGATLALFTSYKMMNQVSEQVRLRVSYPVITQSDLPRNLLMQRFADEEETCLFATMGFWQGIDVAGSSLRHVAVDKLPFAPPNDPLYSARREAVKKRNGNPFMEVDIPRVSTLLAQGVGRLIRTPQDTGVVTVFDKRLAESRYASKVFLTLPPMTRTRNREEATSFLANRGT